MCLCICVCLVVSDSLWPNELFPGGSVGKESTCNAGDRLQCRRPRFDPWIGKSLRKGKGNPLQYLGLENPMDRGAWWAYCPCGRKCRTWLGDWTITTNCSLPGSSCPWNFPGKNTGVSCHFLLQGIFQIQGSNLPLLPLLHWQADFLPGDHLENPLFNNYYEVSSIYMLY